MERWFFPKFWKQIFENLFFETYLSGTHSRELISRLEIEDIYKKFLVPVLENENWKIEELNLQSDVSVDRSVFFNLGSAEPRGSAKIFLGSAKYLNI
jgi:hypothetical protein